MAFNTAISGLRAASSELNVVGNNIANASTTGFKSSRAEFADVYAASVLGGGGNPIGSGVLLADVSQQFSQGNISFTNSSLDLAINGSGFFIISNQGEQLFTRAGLFSLDREGFIETNDGSRVQGFPANESGSIDSNLGDLQIQTDNLEPLRTSEVQFLLNLDATELEPPAFTASGFDAADPETYNSATSVTVFDSQGISHIMTTYYVKLDGTPNTWRMFVQVDDQDVGPGTPATVQSYDVAFNSDGSLATPQPFVVTNWTPVDGDGNPNDTDVGDPTITTFPFPEPFTSSNFAINLSGTTQFGSPFSVNNASQNGFSTGRLAGIDFSNEGLIFARYTNGQSRVLGQIALANFNNAGGLAPQGQSAWAETFDSGQPIVGAPATAALGAIQSGALEDSNVELSEELVALIVAQRNFQANAKTIETESAVTQSIINIR